MVGPIRRRSVLSNNSDVVFLFHLTVERSRCPYHSALSADTELVVVRADLLDAVSDLSPITISQLVSVRSSAIV